MYLVVDETLNTLMPLKQKVHWRAKKGNNGLGKGKDGCFGEDVYVSVPPGTVVRDLKTQKLAGELREPGQKLLVARGGRGGRGTFHHQADDIRQDKLSPLHCLVPHDLIVCRRFHRKRCILDRTSDCP